MPLAGTIRDKGLIIAYLQEGVSSHAKLKYMINVPKDSAKELGPKCKTGLETKVDVRSTNNSSQKGSYEKSTEGELVHLFRCVRVDGERLRAEEAELIRYGSKLGTSRQTCLEPP
jgi:hypothetical protein